MALVNCPECGHQVSESATTCPNCGHPLPGDAGAQVSKSLDVTYPPATALIFAMIAAAALVIGSLLPWISVRSIFGTLNASGIEGDGVLTLVAGGLLGALSGVAWSKRNASKTTGILIVLLGAATGLIAFNVFSNVAGAADLNDDLVFTAVGSGLWLVILGAAMAVGSGVAVFRASGDAVTQRNAWASVAAGALALIILLIALAMANQWAGNEVDQAFQEIEDALNSP